MKSKYIDFTYDINVEYLQAQQEGLNVCKLADNLNQIIDMPEGFSKQEAAKAFFARIESMPMRVDYLYNEPNELAKILTSRPTNSSVHKPVNADYGKILGAWLGRCCGCLLGKPFEGCTRQRITGFLKETGNYPIREYAKYYENPAVRDKYEFTNTWKSRSMIDRVDSMPADDDLNYTVLSLCLLEERGWDFTSDDVADTWMARLPVYQTYTAERVAYRNFLMGFEPPQSATFCNPYREWIGAQIRTDLYGYIAPGDPERAAEMAYRDARISHTKNGIYGAMAVAAMLAEAAVTLDITSVIEAGLSQIPTLSRMTEAISTAQSWFAEGIDWETAIERVHILYNENIKHDWCLATANMMIVIIALLFGACDFTRTIGIAVSAGFDTDCNGATAGSILGMMLGKECIPENFVKPLNNTLNTHLTGEARLSITDAAKRTLKIALSASPVTTRSVTGDGDIEAN